MWNVWCMGRFRQTRQKGLKATQDDNGYKCGDLMILARIIRLEPITTNMEDTTTQPPFTPLLGLRTAIYHADLAKAKAWYAEVLGAAPYFDEPFYVGFNVGGFELGLDPDPTSGPAGPGGATAYRGVADTDAFHAQLLAFGAAEHGAVREVGEGIKVGTVLDPFGNVFGVIENPHFSLPAL